MQLQTLARNCLYLNWALPLEVAPELPAPLRYETHRLGLQDYVFASALLFQLSGLHFRSAPFLRVSYPQMSLRLYVLDGENVPSVLFLRLLVPSWVVPGTRFLAHQPTEAARFSYPTLIDGSGDTWGWKVGRRTSLEVKGWLSSPQPPVGPRMGSWDSTVDYFRHRRRGYAQWKERLRPVKTSHPAVEVWPLGVEVVEFSLLAECLPAVPHDVWLAPHSAWLCPEMPFHFILHKPMAPALAGSGVPAASCYRDAFLGLRQSLPQTQDPRYPRPCATIAAPCPTPPELRCNALPSYPATVSAEM